MAEGTKRKRGRPPKGLIQAVILGRVDSIAMEKGISRNAAILEYVRQFHPRHRQTEKDIKTVANDVAAAIRQIGAVNGVKGADKGRWEQIRDEPADDTPLRGTIMPGSFDEGRSG